MVCPGPDHRDDMPIWELLPAAEFYTFTIPFQMDGPTKVWLHSLCGCNGSAGLVVTWLAGLAVMGLAGLVVTELAAWL